MCLNSCFAVFRRSGAKRQGQANAGGPFVAMWWIMLCTIGQFGVGGLNSSRNSSRMVDHSFSTWVCAFKRHEGDADTVIPYMDGFVESKKRQLRRSTRKLIFHRKSMVMISPRTTDGEQWIAIEKGLHPCLQHRRVSLMWSQSAALAVHSDWPNRFLES